MIESPELAGTLWHPLPDWHGVRRQNAFSGAVLERGCSGMRRNEQARYGIPARHVEA